MKYCAMCECILDDNYEGDICPCCIDDMDPGEEE